ncbi:unnamed protein product [Vicia faba]|uniref:Uncharacterized protein n=1 Tax=Vicia faba TaxID=3906 RepID=A0AAV0Z3V6_VICFA|nr:unnamed protein product [Vicia faba]
MYDSPPRFTTQGTTPLEPFGSLNSSLFLNTSDQLTPPTFQPFKNPTTGSSSIHENFTAMQKAIVNIGIQTQAFFDWHTFVFLPRASPHVSPPALPEFEFPFLQPSNNSSGDTA